MRELEIFRRQARDHAQQATGVYRGPNLVTKAAVGNAQADHDVSVLPEDFSATCELQSAGGGWLFGIDISVIDGPDPIA